MSVDIFIRKLLIKTIILIVLVSGVCLFVSAIGDIINNTLALEQMNSDDSTYVLIQLYNNFIKPTLSIISCCVIVYILYNIGYDVYFFTKRNKRR